jgi:hypothetical protein
MGKTRLKFLRKFGWKGTEKEWDEIITLEYVLTWGYENEGDEERYKFLRLRGDGVL